MLPNHILVADENSRLKELKEISILDTLPEKEYDDITLLASVICEVPISLISLTDTDRQWFKSKVGFDDRQIPNEYSFCAHAILEPHKTLEIPDARLDHRFSSNPYVTKNPGIVFYAGVPLVSGSGNVLGTLCVMDNVERKLSAAQKTALEALARQVVHLFGVRKRELQLEKTKKSLTERMNDLEKFVHVAAHDLKSPLANITLLGQILQMEHSDHLDDKAREIIRMMRETSDALRGMIEGMLSHTKADKIEADKDNPVLFGDIMTETAKLLPVQVRSNVRVIAGEKEMRTNKEVMIIILLNLITNGFKYNRNDKPQIEVEHNTSETADIISVRDNGIGIPEKDKTRVFDLFETGNQYDRMGQKGTGIGLSTVKSLVEKMSGKITLSDRPGGGTEVVMEFPK